MSCFHKQRVTSKVTEHTQASCHLFFYSTQLPGKTSHSANLVLFDILPPPTNICAVAYHSLPVNFEQYIHHVQYMANWVRADQNVDRPQSHSRLSRRLKHHPQMPLVNSVRDFHLVINFLAQKFYTEVGGR